MQFLAKCFLIVSFCSAIQAHASAESADSAGSDSTDQLLLRTSADIANRVNALPQTLSAAQSCSSTQTEAKSPQLLQMDGDGNGGSSTGGNAHTYRPNGPACFLGKDRTIKACTVIAPGFGVSEQEAIATARTAFKTWADYIEKTGLQKHPYAEPFATQVDISAKCDGSEDLRLFFGVTDNPEINQIRKQYPEPWGFENCTRSNSSPSWGKSVIWIAPPKSVDKESPDWSRKNNLLAVVLREVGRMYGNGVVPGTIMREDLTNFMHLLESESIKAEMLAHIDHDRALYRGATDTVSATADDRYQARWGTSFKKLMGRAASGQIKETLQLNNDKGDVTGSLTITDGKGSPRVFKLNLNTLMCFSAGEPVFVRYQRAGSSQQSSASSSGCVMTGRLIAKGGSAHPVMLTRDSGQYQYQMTLLDEPDYYKAEVFNYAPFEYPMYKSKDGKTWSFETEFRKPTR